jgi:YjbR
MTELVRTLRDTALRLPNTTEGIACAGTALESRTIKTNDKAFVFLRGTEARLKLAGSLPEARRMAAKQPAQYTAGAGGWVKIVFAADTPRDVLARWIAESYQLMGGGTSKVAAKPQAPAKSKAKPKAKSKARAKLRT